MRRLDTLPQQGAPMMPRRPKVTRTFPFLICALLFHVPVTWAQQPVACQGDNFVAVATTDNAVILSTLAEDEFSWLRRLPKQRLWRFRVFPVRGIAISTFTVSESAAIAWLTGSNGATELVDLTIPIPEIPIPPSVKAASTLIGADGKRPEWVKDARPCDTPAGYDPLRHNEELRLHLEERAFVPGSTSAWKFFGVAPERELYAPVLEFAGHETVHPSAFDIWGKLNTEPAVQTLTANVEGVRRRASDPAVASRLKKATAQRDVALYRRYRQLQAQKPACSIYYTARSRLGSWILQYWLYYPFDIGGVGPHLHDSEHFFVEVDKLGGTVRRLAGAGHGGWAPNNIFHTFGRDAIPVRLPVHAIVELGKHATAPDVNGDGVFTPGLDANFHWDAAKVWGIRDTTGTTDSNLRAFDASMMVPRARGDRRAISNFTRLFTPAAYLERAETEDNPQATCSLMDLDKVATGERCNEPEERCAVGQVQYHPDRRKTDAILKPGNYPPYVIRLGMSWSPGPAAQESEYENATVGRRSIAYGVDLSQLNIPGRIEVEVLTKDWSRIDVDGLSVRYQRLLSNLIGLYGGLTWLQDLIPEEPDFGEGAWLNGGALFEMSVPRVPRLSLAVQGGLNFDNYFGLGTEFRASIGYVMGTRFRRFGIRATDASPY